MEFVLSDPRELSDLSAWSLLRRGSRSESEKRGHVMLQPPSPRLRKRPSCCTATHPETTANKTCGPGRYLMLLSDELWRDARL